MATEPLTESLRETLALFGESGAPLTTTEAAERLDLGRRSTYERLDRLVERDRLETKKVGASARVWWRPASTEGREAADPQRTDRALRRERSLLETVQAVSPVGIGVFDAAGDPLRVNQRFAELLGRDDDPSAYRLGQQVLLDGDGDVIPYPRRPAARALGTGESVVDRRVRVESDEGATRWLSANAAPLAGEVDGVVVTLADVTALERRTRRLERQRDDLRDELGAVFERIDDGFLALDEGLRFTYVNRRASEVLSRPADELVGERAGDAFESMDVEEPFERALRTQESLSVEEYHDPTGRWFEVTVYPSETGLSVYVRDVTERTERERELERYESLVETVDDGIYAVDQDGRFTLANERYARALGVPTEDVVGSHVTDVFDDEEVFAEARRLEAELAAGERTRASLEAEFTRPSGETWVGEATFTLVDTGDGYERVGVVRDVTERTERERELRRRIRQQEAVADLGQRALGDVDLDGLLAEASELVAEALDADYCETLDLDAGELRLRQGVGWREGVVGSATVSATESASQAAFTFSSGEPVVVEDLDAETRFSDSDLLTSHGVRSGISVVVGPRDDPWGVLGAHDTEPRDFSDHDVAFVQSVANTLASAMERRRTERTLVDQRERLRALNDLNDVVRDVTDAVVEQSSRAEIEATVCERLAAAEAYEFAWMGAVDTRTREVTVRAEAGIEGYLDDATVSVDPDDDRSRGPTGRALLTGEVHTTADVRDDPRYDPWRGDVEEHGVRSSVAVPVAHDGTVYGVLNVYAGRPAAFEAEERAVVGQLGEVVGQAIAAADRKRALMTDDVTAVEFLFPDFLDTVGADASGEGTVSFEGTVSVGDGTFLQYGTVDREAVGALEALVEGLDHLREVTVADPTAERSRFELRMREPPTVSTVASHGGHVRRASVEDGDYHMTIHLPTTVAARRIIDAVQEAYPTARLLTRREPTRSDDALGRVRRTVAEDLTDRQRAALEAAVHSGFFEWPRDASGEDVAAALGVAPSTFHQHLRAAERKVFESLLRTPEAAPATDASRRGGR
jgi:PAS domain S-box-containing protein